MSGPEIRRAGLWVALLVVGLVWALGSRENPRLRPGTRLTAVEAQLADGGSFSLSQERGHVVVLNFWATWCGPCRKGRALGMDYPIGSGSAELIERLAISSVPTTCVIGKDGAIAFSHSGVVSHDELAAAVRAAEER
jgi:peroxiredoxin